MCLLRMPGVVARMKPATVEVSPVLPPGVLRGSLCIASTGSLDCYRRHERGAADVQLWQRDED